MFKFDTVLMSCVEANLKTGSIPMLLGEPGIGKSSWVEALAERMHTKCFTLACNQLADKADLTGARLVPVQMEIRVPDGNGGFKTEMRDSYKQVFYPHQVIHDAIEYANNNPRETPILFMDELNRTTPDVTSEALSIPTLRKIGNMSLPANLKVVTAGNDKGNVTSLDEASISRFVLYPVAPDLGTFLAVNPDLNPFIKATLQKDPSLLFCKNMGAGVVTTGNGNGNSDDDDNSTDLLTSVLDDMEEMNQLTTPRTISALSRWLNQFDNKQLLQMLSTPLDNNDSSTSALEAIIQGHVGQTNFTTFLIQEITNNIMNTANTTTFTFQKPNCYDQMKSCQDMTTLDTFVQNMSPNERSACIVYALSEHEDNSRQLHVLAQHQGNLAPNDAQALMTMLGADQLDSANIEALKATNTPLATAINAFTTMF